MQPEMGCSAEWLEREVKVLSAAAALPAYHKFCKDLGGQYVHGAGTDRYFKHPVFDLPVVRHRFSDTYSELTVKSQVDGNLVRQEVNLRLDGSEADVEKLLQLQGYEIVLEISKISHIYYLPHVVLSYYAVMTPAGELLSIPSECGDLRTAPARFIEVELREDINWVAEFQRSFKDPYCKWVLEGVVGKVFPKNAEVFCQDILRAYLRKLVVAGVEISSEPLEKSLWQMFGERVVSKRLGASL